MEALKNWIIKEMREDVKNGDKVATYYMNGLDNQNEIVVAELAEYIAKMFMELTK